MSSAKLAAISARQNAMRQSAMTAKLRDRHRDAIIPICEEQQRLAALTEGQSRCRSDRSQIFLALADAEGKLEHLRAEAKDNLAFDYVNREKSPLPIAETEALIDRYRSELQRLDEVDQALTIEIAGCEGRLRVLEITRQETWSAVVAADPRFQALFAQMHDAWQTLRTLRATIHAIRDAVPGGLLAKAQTNEPLDSNYVGYETDWGLVRAWQDAIENLKENPDAQLPDSTKND